MRRRRLRRLASLRNLAEGAAEERSLIAARLPCWYPILALEKKIFPFLSESGLSTVVGSGRVQVPATYRNIVLHFVWATNRRLPFIVESIERRLHRMIQAKARELGCEVIAVNGMPDHVHLLVQMPTTLTPADLMQSVK
jgi:hypothetical protein